MASDASLKARRERLLGPDVTTFYDDPVHLVRGEGVWLWDADGRKYLDCYNNVPHVGHGNPAVVEAIRAQSAQLNTHTRYLHELILDYVERLTQTMDDSLSTALMTCTGSEANDVALRMAEAVTGNRGIIVTDSTYHGNTALVSKLSKDRSPNIGFGLESYVRFVPAPETYRLEGEAAGKSTAQAFASAVENEIQYFERSGIGFAALLIDPFFTNEGFPTLSPGWLKPTARVVQRSGGLLIADEVQAGFGRLGTHFWGHHRRGITPDIVTMGKPMGNGHPIGAVVTSFDIMAEFRKAFRYFNTFGGNPVSCAAAMAVLDELHDRDLVTKAAETGGYLRARLRELADRHRSVGDVRGCGLIAGVELVHDPQSKTPAPDVTYRVVNEMRNRGVLLSDLGRYRNILKIRPPMPFDNDNADHLVEVLDQVLGAVAQ